VLSTWTADLPLLEAHGLREPSSVTPHRLPVHMLLRPSMRKFELQTPDARCFVEVCTFSCPRPAFLNRQIILLLNSLGVPDSVFIEMQVRHANDHTPSAELHNQNQSIEK
jgi:hypothetical protein